MLLEYSVSMDEDYVGMVANDGLIESGTEVNMAFYFWNLLTNNLVDCYASSEHQNIISKLDVRISAGMDLNNFRKLVGRNDQTIACIESIYRVSY